jgi:hypothetical protein
MSERSRVKLSNAQDLRESEASVLRAGASVDRSRFQHHPATHAIRAQRDGLSRAFYDDVRFAKYFKPGTSAPRVKYLTDTCVRHA